VQIDSEEKWNLFDRLIKKFSEEQKFFGDFREKVSFV
jgi:hypothetical protein